MQREGFGWRLAIDKKRSSYQVLIAAEAWALELTFEEFEQLRNLCAKLIDQYESCKEQLMAEENLELCLEQGSWWLELKGDIRSWALRFVLTSAAGLRGAEGGWNREAAASFCMALALADIY
ncbi:DUF1818 family protein [Synechococcus sp. UW140]|uniref:DUF1818 family protein n=1 Tax=Synechococcus sp. UW140 TaxID=368503 RepID=UPI0025D05CCF|nr:DUF1818 family protein [Synechococcus sp. UW140]